MSGEKSEPWRGYFSSPLLLIIFAAACVASCDRPESSPSLPTGAADTYSIAIGMPLYREAPGVLANDISDGKELTARLVSAAKYGTVSLQEDGSFNYSPSYKFFGRDSFTYQVIDGETASEPVEVRIMFPNVIVILVDDIGLGDLGAYNSYSEANTPNITALADAGIAFTHAHATAAVCSPSRYSVLTGNYPYRGRVSAGVWHSYQPSTMIVPGQTTLGNIFKDSGYRTGFVGKLHNGGAFWNLAGDDYTMNHTEIDFTRSFDRGPTQFGFDYSFLLPGGVSGRPYAYFENDRLARFNSKSGRYEVFTSKDEVDHHFGLIKESWGALHNGGKVGIGTWAMDNYDSRKAGAILTRKALEFLADAIDESASSVTPKPFFLYFSPPQVHVPYAPPEYFNIEDRNDAEPSTEGLPVAGTTVNSRIDMIRETDLMVGALVEFLEESGQIENTLIVFSSDNGPVTWPKLENRYPPGTESGVELRGMKGHIYEGGQRVPLVARWGNSKPEESAITPGATSAELLGLQDLAATFIALLGQQRPLHQVNDSKSLLPVLFGNDSANAPLRDHLIVQGGLYVRDNENLIERAFYKRDSAGDLWKLSVASSNTDTVAALTWRELYNLSADPGETTDRINSADDQAQLQAMQSEYLQLIVQPQSIVSFR